jgi:hypothetical protein
MKTRAWLTLTIATLLAASIWGFSPLLTGKREPWDVEGYFYLVALVIAGSLAGLIAPRPLWAHYVGAFIGQLGYQLLFLRIGPLILLGAIFLLGYSLVFAIAAALVGQVRSRVNKRLRSVGSALHAGSVYIRFRSTIRSHQRGVGDE